MNMLNELRHHWVLGSPSLRSHWNLDLDEPHWTVHWPGLLHSFFIKINTFQCFAFGSHENVHNSELFDIASSLLTVLPCWFQISIETGVFAAIYKWTQNNGWSPPKLSFFPPLFFSNKKRQTITSHSLMFFYEAENLPSLFIDKLKCHQV